MEYLPKSEAKKSNMEFTLQHFQNHLQDIAPELFDLKASCILAVSGGPDSMCLLWAMKELLPKEQLFVVHVNYQLRGAESDKDQRLVEEVLRGADRRS